MPVQTIRQRFVCTAPPIREERGQKPITLAELRQKLAATPMDKEAQAITARIEEKEDD